MYGYLTQETKQRTTAGPDKCKWISENALVVSWLFNSVESNISGSFLLLGIAHEVWISISKTYF